MNLRISKVNFYIEDPPFQIHATWSYRNASETITIIWRTKFIGNSVVKFDQNPRGGIPTNYRWEIRGETRKYANIEGYLHIVSLSNLDPNTTYYLICGSDKNGWSEELSFKTPSIIPNEITFVVGGDSRSNPEIRNQISELMAQYNPEFVLFVGDAVNDGGDQKLWDSWFEHMHKYWIKSGNTVIPIVPCLGNHEKNASNYYAQYALPNNEQWYSIDYSSLIHIICLNTEGQIDGNQQTWLTNDLEKHKDTLWKFVFFHQPIYSSGPHGSRKDLQEILAPLFDKYNVNIVFSGHDHIYERSKPIRNNTVVDSYEHGTMYIVTGGWGAPLYELQYNWWTAYGESEYHFCLIQISIENKKTRLLLKEIRLNNTIGDSVVIERNLTKEFFRSLKNNVSNLKLSIANRIPKSSVKTDHLSNFRVFTSDILMINIKIIEFIRFLPPIWCGDANNGRDRYSWCRRLGTKPRKSSSGITIRGFNREDHSNRH